MSYSTKSRLSPSHSGDRSSILVDVRNDSLAPSLITQYTSGMSFRSRPRSSLKPRPRKAASRTMPTGGRYVSRKSYRPRSIGTTILFGSTSTPARHESITPARVDWAAFSIPPAAPAYLISIFGGFVNPTCTADTTGRSLVRGERRTCNRPEHLM